MIYPYIYINGKILPQEKALIPVWDLGLLRGLGIFDFFRVIDGVPVFVEDHVERLMNSMAIMGLDQGVSKEEWISRIHEMIHVNEAQQAGFRIVVTGGFSEDGYTIPAEKNVFILLHGLGATSKTQYEQGVSLLLKNYQRDIPAAKTTIYVQSMQQQPTVIKAGAFETLYHWNNIITECSRCNIFFIDQNGALHTPAENILKGITRKQILGIAGKQGIRVSEREIKLEEIQNMAGAFLTASTKGALPVTRIGDHVIGDGSVHPLAVQLESLFEKRVADYIQARR